MTMVQHWNGAEWQIVQAPSPGVFDSELLGVDGVALDDIWAVGFASDDEFGLRRPLAIGDSSFSGVPPD